MKSSITGSRPSGWYFSLKDEASYNEHLAYVHLGKKQIFDKAALERMSYGAKWEDVAALRLIEFGLQQKLDVWIYEAGFVRHKHPKLSYLGASPDGVVGILYTGTVIAERRTRHGHLELLMAYYDLCNEVQCAVVSGQEKIKAGFDHIPTGLYKACTASYDEKIWQKSEHEGKRISTMVHAALEIKCPQKMYSNVPLYYFCQLHMEMACYNLKEAIFVTWHVKGSVERTRIWKIKFNAAFFETFTNDVCELFRSVNADGSRGAPWPTFKQTWLDFKRTFGSVKVWKPFVTPLFDNRKFSLEKEFVDTVDTEA